MNKTLLRYFVSYAAENEALVTDFCSRFQNHAGLLKHIQLQPWTGLNIVVGENWHNQIQEAIGNCDFGLLLLSSAFFNRRYIKEDELPHFISRQQIIKPIVPVGLEYFDIAGDLLGLQHTQIFRYKQAPGKPYRFYSEVKTRRPQFINQLLQQVELKFQRKTN